MPYPAKAGPVEMRVTQVSERYHMGLRELCPFSTLRCVRDIIAALEIRWHVVPFDRSS